MRTNAKIIFDQYDRTAKTDGTASCTDLQTWSDAQELMQDGAPVARYNSLEDDYTLLDGSFLPFPDSPSDERMGVFSASMADASGNFAVNPKLTFSFTENHTSVGVTLHFDPAGYWPREIIGKWYNAANDIISITRVFPDAVDFFIDNTVDDYRKVELEFIGMSAPYRYLKISAVEFGFRHIFSGDTITKASLLEELDPISSELPINTVSTTVYSKDSNFSILNPKGGFSSLQQRQVLHIYETVDGADTYLGDYYLNEWSCTDENNLTLSGVSALGVLDGINFHGGIYTGYAVAQLVSDILGGLDIQADISGDYSASTVNGYLPICTAREALQQMAFAIGAVVDCSRSDKIKIYPTPVRPGKTIKKSQKISGQTLKQRDLVTGVKVTAYTYTANTASEELYKETLAPGDYEIEFNEPAHTLSATGATILSSGANFAVLHVDVGGEVILTGCGYDVTCAVIRHAGAVPGGASPNILEVTDATLVNPENARMIADKIYAYYQWRNQNAFSIIPGGEESPGDMVLVESMHGERLRGFIESMEIDLASGYVAKIFVTGERIETTFLDYLGEIYCNNEVGVM